SPRSTWSPAGCSPTTSERLLKSRSEDRIVKRIIALIVVLTATSGALFSQEKSFITFTGDVDGQAIMNSLNEASVYPGPFTEVTAGGLVDGKVTFSRQYTTLGLLDFTFQDANVIDHLNGAK